MNVTKITRMEPNGPGGKGLDAWPKLPPEVVDEGDPVQTGYKYYEDDVTGLRVGIWNCTEFKSKMEPHAVHEFMHLISGTVTIVHGDGSTLTATAGEQFFIPKGTMRQWTQSGEVRKYFMIFPDPSGAEADDPDSLRAFKIDQSEEMQSIPVPGELEIIGETPEWKAKKIFEDPTGQYTFGLWQATPFEMKPAPIDHAELMLPFEGTMTLKGDGETHTFAPGEAAFVPKGAECVWASTDKVTKVFCSFRPKA